MKRGEEVYNVNLTVNRERDFATEKISSKREFFSTIERPVLNSQDRVPGCMPESVAAADQHDGKRR